MAKRTHRPHAGEEADLNVLDARSTVGRHLLLEEGGLHTAQDLLASDAPFVVQFLHARPTGPVAFHMKSAPYRDDLGIRA